MKKRKFCKTKQIGGPLIITRKTLVRNTSIQSAWFIDKHCITRMK